MLKRIRSISLSNYMAIKWIIKLVLILIMTQIFRLVDLLVVKPKFEDILALRLMSINLNFVNVYSPILAWMVDDILLAHSNGENLDKFREEFHQNFNQNFVAFQDKEYMVKFDQLMVKDEIFNEFYENTVVGKTCEAINSRPINCEDFPLIQRALKNGYKKPYFNLLILFRFFNDLIPEPSQLKSAIDDKGFTTYARSSLDAITG